MNQSQIASGRHHTYLLISRIYLEGLSPELLPYVQQISELAAFLGYPFDQDEEASRHYHVLGHDIVPYESIFRETSGLLGGQLTAQVNLTYKASGVDFPYEGDHFGQEVAFLAALCAAEASARKKEDLEAVDYFVDHQFQFMVRHLLRWLSPFLAALACSLDPFYAALGRMTFALIGDHWRSLADISTAGMADQPQQSAPSQLTELLHQPKTNLKAIADFLATPALSGFYLGPDAIGELARENGLPRGFGGRRQILTNLLHSAAQYELLPKILLDLADICCHYHQAYRHHVDQFPELTLFCEPWIVLVENSYTALQEMITLASQAPASA